MEHRGEQPSDVRFVAHTPSIEVIDLLEVIGPVDCVSISVDVFRAVRP
jgi:hypothetical protein